MTKIEKRIGEQLVELLKNEPQHYDVVFSVGPEKIKVEAVKIILKASSPVFRREFKENWESAVMKEGDGIPLPDIDPDVFKLFVHLIISDKWSVDDLKSLDLDFATMLNLLELCRRFEITKGIKNLEEATDLLVQDFSAFKDTHEFLEISRKNLETILSCDAIPLDEKEIFECTCRWAEYQCKQKTLELTGETFREVLGSCFYEIRFPTMKFKIFVKISVFKKNLFTAEEKNDIYEFIGLDEDEKVKYDKALLPFKTDLRCPRILLSYSQSVLRLPKQFKITANPLFECNGNFSYNHFQVNTRILLYGVGFLGPIDRDTYYDVTVQLIRAGNGGSLDSGTLNKRNIFARKGKIFHFLFDEPIAIEPNSYDRSWNNYYCFVHYSLKGASNVPQHKVKNPSDESVQISGVEFNLHSNWNDGRPLAELLYELN